VVKTEHGGSRASSRKENEMANNPDFKKIVRKNVKLVWPRLDQPYRFNERDQKTEPCAPTASGAAWSVAIELPMDEAKALWEECKAHYEECQTRDKSLPAFSDVFGRKKDEEKGVALFSAKCTSATRDGDAKRPPKVVGPDQKPLEGDDLKIWSDSIAHVRLFAVPSKNPQNGQGGVTLLLDAVQVMKAEYGSDGLEDDFGPAEEADPDFGDEATTPPPAQTAQPAPAASGAGF
jgi:hypothetical protein